MDSLNETTMMSALLGLRQKKRDKFGKVTEIVTIESSCLGRCC